MSNTPNITIRPALDSDYDSIYQIWMEGVEISFDLEKVNLIEAAQNFKSNFKCRNGVFNFWVAIVDDKIVGWQSLIRNSYHPFRQNALAESSTYLSKHYRFGGLGQMLMNYAIEEAKKSALEYIIGHVVTTNKAALKITKETGWQIVGVLPPSPTAGEEISKYLMVRPV
nr:GNAT family N-acetyltransferase [Pedobacter sp. ASV19]